MSTYIEVASHPLKLIFRRNRPLLSSKNPRFQNEARCTTFLLKMSFIAWEWKMITISKASTYPRFETEARGNSEMAYWTWFKSPISDCQSWRFFFFFQVKRQWVLDLLYYYSPLFSGKRTCATHGHISGISYMATVIRSTKELTMWVKPQKWWIRHRLALVTD